MRTVSTPGSASYGHYLAPGEFGPRFGATPQTIAAVTGALRADGLNAGRPSANGLTIPVLAPASAWPRRCTSPSRATPSRVVARRSPTRRHRSCRPPSRARSRTSSACRPSQPEALGGGPDQGSLAPARDAEGSRRRSRLSPAGPRPGAMCGGDRRGRPPAGIHDRSAGRGLRAGSVLRRRRSGRRDDGRHLRARAGPVERHRRTFATCFGASGASSRSRSTAARGRRRIGRGGDRHRDRDRRRAREQDRGIPGSDDRQRAARRLRGDGRPGHLAGQHDVLGPLRAGHAAGRPERDRRRDADLRADGRPGPDALRGEWRSRVRGLHGGHRHAVPGLAGRQRPGEPDPGDGRRRDEPGGHLLERGRADRGGRDAAWRRRRSRRSGTSRPPRRGGGRRHLDRARDAQLPVRRSGRPQRAQRELERCAVRSAGGGLLPRGSRRQRGRGSGRRKRDLLHRRRDAETLCQEGNPAPAGGRRSVGRARPRRSGRR